MTTSTSMSRFDVLVHGSGIVGGAAALALAQAGLRVAMTKPVARGVGTGVGPGAGVDADARTDVRAFAINRGSQALLERVGAWARLAEDARTPVYDMHVEGDSGSGAIDFSAWQQRVRELAWIVDAAALEAALHERVEAAGIERVDAAGDRDAAALDRRATLHVVAEGKGSTLRERLGVRFERHDYGQSAVAARLVADRPHGHTARQWFLAPEVLALLPFDRPEPGHGFGLVWSVSTERAKELLAMSTPDFDQALAAATQGRAGALRVASERASWPLAVGRAERHSGTGLGAAWVLIGDAAHQVHPLAGQGLNLGLGDAAALAEVLAAREPWRGLNDERLLERYVRQRAWPVAAMRGGIDALQGLFAHPSPLVRELRNRGLGLVDSMSAVKRWLAAEAFGR